MKQRPKVSLLDYLKISNAVYFHVCFSGGSEEFINTYKDIEKFRLATNASSVMIARTAQFNCSIFRKEGLLPTEQVIKDYLKLVRFFFVSQ